LVTFANPRFGTSARKVIRSRAKYENRLPRKLELILLSVPQAMPYGAAVVLLPIVTKLPISADMAFNRQSAQRGACRALTHNPGGY
jgi:hypothetical protein